MILLIAGVIAIHFSFMWWLNNGIETVAKSTDLVGNQPELESIDFTIVIPFRDEESNIPELIRSLRKQKLEEGSVKIIFINDHSNDNSVSRIEDLINHQFPFEARILSLNNDEGQGKKTALNKAIERAESEYIIQIDSDVTLPETWLNTIIKNVNSETDLLILPVGISGNGHWFQEFEFSALQFVTFGMGGNDFPILCNGANLVYKKSAWLAAYESIQKGDSGDDIFLLQQFIAENLNIHFAISSSLIANTGCAESFKDFIHQRLRWAGKNSNVSIPKYKVTTIYLGLLQLLPIIICILNIKIGLAFLIFKIAIDYYFIKMYRQRYKEKSSIFYFVLSALIMPFYLFALISGQFLIKPNWKGRKVNV